MVIMLKGRWLLFLLFSIIELPTLVKKLLFERVTKIWPFLVNLLHRSLSEMSVKPSFGTQHKVMSGKKRIMVCGGAGFIGCHLCTRLVEMVTYLFYFISHRVMKLSALIIF